MKARGFTLVELVMVMVVIGVMAAALTSFLKPTISGYADVRLRADLTDMASTSLQRIARDIHTAVPNSVRSISPGCFQLVPTVAGGRYRMDSDTVNDDPPLPCTPSATCSAPLDVTTATGVFDVLSPLASVPAQDDWIVIGNQRTDDVYLGNNRARIVAPPTTPRASDGSLRIAIEATQFPSGYDRGRFVVVPKSEPTVIYSCVGESLYRKATTDFSRADAGACAAATDGDIVATDVVDCTFVHSPNQGATQQSGFVWMRLELRRDSEGVALAQGVHVDNVP